RSLLSEKSPETGHRREGPAGPHHPDPGAPRRDRRLRPEKEPPRARLIKGVLADQVEQAGEAGVEVGAAEADGAAVAPVDLADQAGLAEDPEVVGPGGLGHREAEPGAGVLGTLLLAGQGGDDAVAQRF